MRVVSFCALLTGLLLSAGEVQAQQSLTVDALNSAQWSIVNEKSLSATALKAQVLLDRAGFSPGVIDAYGGENFKKALTAFQAKYELKPSGDLDEPTWTVLTQTSSEPVVMEYQIAAADVKGPFVESIPQDYEKMAELERLSYRGPRELIAEKFHMDEDLLTALNARKSFREEGTTIVVVNVRNGSRGQKAARVVVDLTERSVRALAADGTLIAYFPASVGSDDKPAPRGMFEVRAVTENPVFRYNPQFKFRGQNATEPVEIAAGPNNPVGVAWIALSADTYGIHGTPWPDKVSKTASHGCVRLTNWDALALARMVKKGTPVEFKD
jgi:lipoprotein-anchoring transpeptidase ErfK/SrfK